MCPMWVLSVQVADLSDAYAFALLTRVYLSDLPFTLVYETLLLSYGSSRQSLQVHFEELHS